jgi:hypothetical protein
MTIIEQLLEIERIKEEIRLETNRAFQLAIPGTSVSGDSVYADYPDYLSLLTAQFRQWLSLFEQIRRAINRRGVFVGANEPFAVFPERIMMIGGSTAVPDLKIRGALEIRYGSDDPIMFDGNNKEVALGLTVMENVDVAHIPMPEKQGFSSVSFDILGYLTGTDSAVITFFGLFTVDVSDIVIIPNLPGISATDNVVIA